MLEHGGFCAAGWSGAAQQQPGQRLAVGEFGLGIQAHAGQQGRAGHAHAGLLVALVVGAQGQDVEHGVVGRAVEAHDAFADLQLLAVGAEGAAFGADFAADARQRADGAAGRGLKPPGQARVDALSAQGEGVAQVQAKLGGEGGFGFALAGLPLLFFGFGVLRTFAAAIGAVNDHVVVQRGGAVVGQFDVRLIHAQLAIERGGAALHGRLQLAGQGYLAVGPDAGAQAA